MKRNDKTLLTQAGEAFGAKVAEHINAVATHTVTVDEVDDSFAYASTFGVKKAIRVPLAILNLGTTLIKVCPTVGSTAVVANLDGKYSTPFFVGFTEVDQVDVTVGESTIRVTSDEIQFNGGENDGLVIIGKLTDRLNQLQSEIERIQTSILAHSHAVAGTATSSTVYTKVNVERFANSDYENTKITQ